jgi:hypothetical protein
MNGIPAESRRCNRPPAGFVASHRRAIAHGGGRSARLARRPGRPRVGLARSQRVDGVQAVDSVAMQRVEAGPDLPAVPVRSTRTARGVSCGRCAFRQLLDLGPVDQLDRAVVAQGVAARPAPAPSPTPARASPAAHSRVVVPWDHPMTGTVSSMKHGSGGSRSPKGQRLGVLPAQRSRTCPAVPVRQDDTTPGSTTRLCRDTIYRVTIYMNAMSRQIGRCGPLDGDAVCSVITTGRPLQAVDRQVIAEGPGQDRRTGDERRREK